MKWTRRTADDLLAFEAKAEDSTPAQRLASAAAVWIVVESELLPRHQEKEWDVLRLEVWPDSGRTILFPAREPYEERTDRALAEVHWPLLQQAWDRCETDDSIDDGAFEAKISEVVDSIVLGFRDSFSQSKLREDLRVNCYSYGDDPICSFGKPRRSDR